MASPELAERMRVLNLEVQNMKRDPVSNYIVPGLTSSLVGGEGRGLVRLFESERNHREFISPHDHRFDFTCLVLAGSVRNTIYQKIATPDAKLLYKEREKEWERWAYGCITEPLNPGEYPIVERGDEVSWFIPTSAVHVVGDVYTMLYHEFHSIEFGKGAKVLFFEGPSKRQVSYFLEPVVDGKRVPTFKTESWMFQREQRPEPF